MRRPTGARRDATPMRLLATAMWLASVVVALSDREGWVLLVFLALVLTVLSDER